MAEDTDFSALYRMLGIDPACGVTQLRQAYRRSVARLHPDQRGDRDDMARLQELNRLYRAAMEFLRTHGRLPGAPVPILMSESVPAPAADTLLKSSDTATAVPTSPARSAPVPVPADADKAGSDQHSRYFIWLAVLAIAVLALHALGLAEHLGFSGSVWLRPDVGAATVNQDMIMLGMPKARVKRIQGSPLQEQGVRWEYGPSWIEFGCGDTVTDWYNSPIYALRTASPRPRLRDWERFDSQRPARC